MAEIKFVDFGETFELPDGSPILEVAQEAGIPIGCSDGLCGICTVTVLSGAENLCDPTEAENEMNGPNNRTTRLCCQAHIKSGIVEVKKD